MKRFAIISLLTLASQLFGATSNAFKIVLNNDNLGDTTYGIRISANNNRLRPSSSGTDQEGIAFVPVPIQLTYPFNWNTINTIRLSLWQPNSQRLAGIVISQGKILNLLKNIASTGNIPTLNITYNPTAPNKIDVKVSEEMLTHAFME